MDFDLSELKDLKFGISLYLAHIDYWFNCISKDDTKKRLIQLQKKLEEAINNDSKM